MLADRRKIAHRTPEPSPLNSGGKDELVACLSGQLPHISYVELLRWDAGRRVKMHAHPDRYQFDHFPVGSGEYSIGGVRHRINSSFFYAVPPTTDHAITSAVKKPLVGLSIKCSLRGLKRSPLPHVFVLDEPRKARATALMRSVISEHILEQDDRRLAARLLMAELLLCWLDGIKDAEPGPRLGSKPEATLALIRNRFKDPLTLRDMANGVGTSPSYLCRAVRAELGRTPFELLRQVRVESAKDRLKAGEESATAIARRTGFTNLQQMNRAFRQMVGMTPCAYRRREARSERRGADGVKGKGRQDR